MSAPCVVDACERLAKAGGMCWMHFNRVRAGKPLAGPHRLERTPLERFWEKVDKRGPDDCWNWTGAMHPGGYGSFLSKNAHRAAYELLVGPIPAGLHIDHLCRNRLCVNPAHLEAVTQRENTMRGETVAARNAAKTECLRGHPFDEGNTLRRDGGRWCRRCAAMRSQQIRDRKKAARV